MSSAPLFVAALTSYAANCALGSSVALKLVDSSGFRWVHHALYVSTFALAGAAIVSGAVRGGRARGRRRGCGGARGPAAAVALAPAVVPLALIPFLGSRSRKHVAVSLSAAPFFVAGVVRSRRV
ncbi:hypothetical protein [Marisediminicola sp. LYQ134]|uniref:hypothetical protein n=1 Tax=Marisediminicola sp. LYQ134 TaxID=3391061 RepID=UPI003983D4F1